MEDMTSSWGLSLFVLFERMDKLKFMTKRSWGLSLFVLFEQDTKADEEKDVLED